MKSLKELGQKALSDRLPEKVFTRIHEDIGHASMCWTNIEQAGVFKSEVACEIAFDLCHYIADLLEGKEPEGGGIEG